MRPTKFIIESLTGFLIATYILQKKRSQNTFTCIGEREACGQVVKSHYSRFCNIPLEILGITYYSIVAIWSGTLLVFPNLELSEVASLMYFFITTAFLFSIYLTYVQAYKIKQWCIWCLASGGASTVIFLTFSFNSFLTIF